MKKRQKILFITYENPLLRDNGDRIYTCNLLDTFIDLDCDISIIAYDIKNSNSANNVKMPNNINLTLLPFKKVSKLKFIFSLLPGMIVNRKRKSYIDFLETHLKNNLYDCIFVNHFKMIFSLEAILKVHRKSRLFHISHNAEYLLSLNNAKNSKSLFDKLVYLQDSLKTKLYEKKWLHHFDLITTISEYDQDYYEKLLKYKKISVLRPVFEIVNLNSKVNKDINQVIIVGSFLWGPKIENLLSFLNSKNFKQLHSNDISLTIVGNAEPLLVKTINSKFKGVFMTGRVESVGPYYDKAKIAIIPEFLGGGFKLKIAEAALRKTAIFAVKGAITKCNLNKDIHYIEAVNFNDLIVKIIDYQKREFEIDTMINKAYETAIKDFSQKRINLDISKLL